MNELANEYVMTTNVVENIMRMMIQMIQQNGVDPNDVMDLEKLRAGLKQMTIQIYSDVYTQTELTEALAFANSKTGQSLRAKQSEVETLSQAAASVLFQECLKRFLDWIFGPSEPQYYVIPALPQWLPKVPDLPWWLQ